MQQLSMKTMSVKSKLGRFALILVCSLCLSRLVARTASSRAAPGARMWLDPPTLDLAPGDVATLDLRVESTSQLAGAEVHVTFDPALLEVIDADSATEGTQIAHGDFLSPDFVVQNSANPGDGTVDYAIASMELDQSASGSGVLARITFRALAEGETLVTISGALLADLEGQPIEVETGSSVAVISRPGPSAGVWLMIGLVAAAVVAGFIAVAWNTMRER